MKMKSLLLPILMVIMPPMVVTETPLAGQPDAAGGSGTDLNGMMFTLSRDSGGITFSRPDDAFHSPTLTTRYKAKAPATPTASTTTRAPNTTTVAPYTTTVASNTTTATTTRAPNTTTVAPNTTTIAPNTTTATTTRAPNTTTIAPNTTTATTTRAPNTTTVAPNTTTATTVSPARGVSVCLRYVTDAVQHSFPLFTVSPDGSPLSLQGSYGAFILSDNFYFNVGLEPIVRLWPKIKRDIWTSVCLTVDTSKHVVQLFNDGYMSPRKVLPHEYEWTGEPVINFPGFDGQLTDVHVWDYPLSYRNIFHYMSSRYYSGSVLSWSHIRYSVAGNAVMEESYDLQAKQAIREAEQEGAPKKAKKLRFFRVGEKKRVLFK